MVVWWTRNLHWSTPHLERLDVTYASLLYDSAIEVLASRPRNVGAGDLNVELLTTRHPPSIQWS